MSMRPPLGALGALALAPLVGCSLQAAAAGGVRTTAIPEGLWSAPMGASFHLPGTNVLVGAELEGSANAARGARWSTGLRLGYQSTPASRRIVPGFEVALEGGSPLSGGGLGPGWYAGLMGAAVIWFWPRASEADRNRGTWFFRWIPQLVVFARGRVIDDRVGGPSDIDLEFTIGVGGRVRIVSDLLP